MSGRHRRAGAGATLAGLLLSLVLTGCRVDLTALPVRETPFLFVGMDARADGTWELFAILQPGVGEDGRPRPVPDDSLRLGDLALAPDEVDEDGVRRYRLAEQPMPSEPDELLIRPPRVAGAPEPTVIQTAIPLVTGPDTVRVGSGTELEIHLRGLGDPEAGFWSLHLDRPGDGSPFSISAGAVPPPVIRVSTDLLPADVDGARLRLRGSLLTRAQGGYEVRLTRGFAEDWPIRSTGS